VTNNSILLEISVESASGAAAAERGGANRIELCANLNVGGVTPSAELMHETRRAVRAPIFVMIRPRGGDFVFSAEEFFAMRRDLKIAKSCGMDGAVFGILHANRTVDLERTRELVEAAKPLPVTFHRAFDETPDLHAALEAVISTGATRILTSGGKPKADAGARVLAELVKVAAGRITILPGGGINAGNLETVVRATGTYEVHSGLGTSLPYGKSGAAEFESAVRELADILNGAQSETARE
jgi:copper homeostasis protein